MIKQIAIIVAALVSSSAFANIHQWTDKDGVVHFSDSVPQGMKLENVKTIDVPEVQVVKSEMNTVKPTGQYNQPQQPTPILSVVAPANDEFIRDNTGTVTIAGQAQNVSGPHEPELLLDGNVIAKGYSPVVTLTNLDRGTHTVQMKATDANGRVYASKVVSFTLQRAHRK